MTVRDLIENTTCGILLTSEEDPNNSYCLPEIEIPANCTDATWWLSNEVLDHEVYLMTVKNGNIYASLFVRKEKEK